MNLSITLQSFVRHLEAAQQSLDGYDPRLVMRVGGKLMNVLPGVWPTGEHRNAVAIQVDERKFTTLRGMLESLKDVPASESGPFLVVRDGDQWVPVRGGEALALELFNLDSEPHE